MIQSIGKKKRRKKRGDEGPESSIHRRISHHRPQNTNNRSRSHNFTLYVCPANRSASQPASQRGGGGYNFTGQNGDGDGVQEFRSGFLFIFFLQLFTPYIRSTFDSSLTFFAWLAGTGTGTPDTGRLRVQCPVSSVQQCRTQQENDGSFSAAAVLHLHGSMHSSAGWLDGRGSFCLAVLCCAVLWE